MKESINERSVTYEKGSEIIVGFLSSGSTCTRLGSVLVDYRLLLRFTLYDVISLNGQCWTSMHCQWLLSLHLVAWCYVSWWLYVAMCEVCMCVCVCVCMCVHVCACVCVCVCVLFHRVLYLICIIYVVTYCGSHILSWNALLFVLRQDRICDQNQVMLSHGSVCHFCQWKSVYCCAEESYIHNYTHKRVPNYNIIIAVIALW